MLKPYNIPDNKMPSSNLIMKSRISALESLIEEISASKCTTFEGVVKLINSSIRHTNEIKGWSS